MAILDRNLREHLHIFWQNDKGALFVLLYLQMKANNRSRAFPSISQIAKDTGMNERTAKRSLKFLEDIGVIEKVPYDLRVGYEKSKAYQSQNVYELQTVGTHDGNDIPILYAGKEEDVNKDTRVPNEQKINSDMDVPNDTNSIVTKRAQKSIVTPVSPKVFNIDKESSDISQDKKLSQEPPPISPPGDAGLDKPTTADDEGLDLETDGKSSGSKKKLTNQQYRNSLSVDEQKRWDELFYAIELAIHEINISNLPADKRKEMRQVWAKQIHDKVRFAMSFEWMDADEVEKFVQFYEQKIGKDKSKPTKQATFKEWLAKYAVQRNEEPAAPDYTNGDIVPFKAPFADVKQDIDQDAKNHWRVMLDQFRVRFNEATYASWFAELELLKVEENVFVVGARNRLIKDYLIRKHLHAMVRDLSSFHHAACTIKLVTPEEMAA